ERFREQLVDRLARLEPLAELVGLRQELGVPERLDRGLERVARLDRGHHALDVALVLGAEDLPEDHVDHQNRLWHTARLTPAFRAVLTCRAARARGRARCR